MTDRFPLTVVAEHGAPNGFEPFFEQLHLMLTDSGHALNVPAFELTTVLTGDMTASVTRRGEDRFLVERIGGTVSGKTLPQTRDYSSTAIVLDAAALGADGDFDPLVWVRLVAHEYGHAFLGRLRAASGTRPPRPVRHQTLAEAAVVLAYESTDELRCDLFSNQFLNRVTIDPEDSGELTPRPLHLGDELGDGFLNAFRDALDTTVYPGWPDLVGSYRRHQLGLLSMVSKLVGETQSLLILAAHADAVESARGNPALMASCAGHPGVDLYLRDAWQPLRNLMDTTSPIPGLANFAMADRAVQARGRGIVDMWRQLGVEGHLNEDQVLQIHVREPVR